MTRASGQLEHALKSPDLRILTVMVAGIAVFGVVDGSMWRTLLTPTLAYRPAILFGLTLVFGWRGFAWSQLLFLAAFTSFFGWRGAVFITPPYLLSHACALAVARRIARKEPWLLGERSTLAFLAGAVLAPAIPALVSDVVLRVVGTPIRPGVPSAVDSWLRGVAGILALAPILLVHCSGSLRKWAGLPPDREWQLPATTRNFLLLGAEMAVWITTLWLTVHFKATFGLNITYLTFLPPLAFTLVRGMRFAALALAENAVIASTLWYTLHWSDTLSAVDLRLLIAIYSMTILLLAAVVDESQRGRVQVARLLAAEAALRESEERLRFSQQVASIGTFEWNIKTGLSTWTPELESMHGLPPGGFRGSHAAWETLIHPDDRTRIGQRVSESFETEAPLEDEWRVIWPDGSVRWLAARWQALKNAAGEPVRVMGVNIDVTERKHMEEALRKSEERFRLAIEATNDAIWDVDLEAKTVSWNETYSTLYGRSGDTSDSWQWWIDRIHPEDRERTVSDFHTAIASRGSSWTCEYRFRRADGDWAYVYDRAYIARDASGNAWRVIGAMQDLTGRKQAEAALRESEERFRRVFEEGPLGLALVGKDYRFLKVNSALCQMVGYSDAELVQKTFADITHPDDVRADVELAERLFRRDLPFYRLQKRYVKKTGEIIWINLTASLIYDRDGQPLHGLAMVEDVTEVKRAQDEAFARQKLESVGLLANGIAHDFNNLLGSILAEAELGATELAEGESPLESIQRISTVASRGAEIVRELMIFSGQDNADPVEPVELSGLVEEMLELLKVSISKRVTLKVDLPRNLPPVPGRASQIRQIVMNLIINASEAIGGEGGTIQVDLSRTVLPRNHIQNSGPHVASGNYLKLKVSDTGVGMTEDVQAKVFDPFFSTKFAGRGMGLAVVQKIVRDHAGTISLTSAPGQGTTFEVLLPCVEEMAGHRGKDTQISGKEPRSSSGTVLVVEDEGALRFALTNLLRRNGFEVVEAPDGSSALELLRAGNKIDVMLLDVTLPGVSSREVFEEAQRTRPNLKAILTSAYSRETVESRFPGVRIARFIRKPFRVLDLMAMLEEALSE
jgi:PAS domain S-box-containing protein